MRMFCYFIWVGLDIYAVLVGLWVYKSFLFSCGVVRAVTSPSDAAYGRASSPARVRAYKERIRMLLLYLTLLTITHLEPKASKSLHYSLPRVRGRCRTK